MANTCPGCGSQDVQSGIGDTVWCMDEQKRYTPDGTVVGNGPDQETVDRVVMHATPHAPVVVGNQADVMRQGADLADTLEGEELLDAGVVVPSDGVHPAEHDAARGQITRETLRTGIHGEEDLEPPAPGPGDGTNAVDPTSVSPVPVEAGKKSGDAAVKAEDKVKAAKAT